MEDTQVPSSQKPPTLLPIRLYHTFYWSNWVILAIQVYIVAAGEYIVYIVAAREGVKSSIWQTLTALSRLDRSVVIYCVQLGIVLP